MEKGALDKVVREEVELKTGGTKKRWFSRPKTDKAKQVTTPNASYWTLYRYAHHIVLSMWTNSVWVILQSHTPVFHPQVRVHPKFDGVIRLSEHIAKKW